MQDYVKIIGLSKISAGAKILLGTIKCGKTDRRIYSQRRQISDEQY